MFNKILLAILLAILSNGAMAEWKYIGTDAEVDNNFYIDPTSIKKQGSKVIVWHLSDFASPQTDFAKPYSSAKSKVAIDCKKETMKYLAALYHEGHMGKGGAVEIVNAESSEYPIPPDTNLETLMKAACGKK